MRVLHLGKYYPPYRGGIEQFLGDLLPALREEGVEPAALVHAHFRPEREMRPFPVWRVPTYGQWLYAPVSPAFPLWLKEMMSTFRPDLLHLHLPNVSAFWALAVPAARRLPWIVHWHADVVPSQLELRLRLGYWAYRPLEQKLLRRAEKIIVTSSPYRDSSVALKPWLEKTEVVPLGLDPSRLSGPDLCSCLWAEKQWGEEDRLRLLCIGRLTYYKGHRVLFQALSQIEGIKLLCAGGGELAGELANQIRRHGLEAKAELLGEVSDAYRNALLASCDVLVLPSVERTEAFGLVLLEAMAYGKPAIAARIPGSGIGWVVKDGQTGWLVPPQDPGALAERIEFVRQHPKLRQRAGELGRQRFIQHFHIRACARQIAKLYQIVC
ncbi:MAG: glycosyltransferase [Methylohalobius sp.]|nr:glycosyltransferase [Methylohalobius sp.]